MSKFKYVDNSKIEIISSNDNSKIEIIGPKDNTDNTRLFNGKHYAFMIAKKRLNFTYDDEAENGVILFDKGDVIHVNASENDKRIHIDIDGINGYRGTYELEFDKLEGIPGKWTNSDIDARREAICNFVFNPMRRNFEILNIPEDLYSDISEILHINCTKKDPIGFKHTIIDTTTHQLEITMYGNKNQPNGYCMTTNISILWSDASIVKYYIVYDPHDDRTRIGVRVNVESDLFRSGYIESIVPYADKTEYSDDSWKAKFVDYEIPLSYFLYLTGDFMDILRQNNINPSFVPMDDTVDEIIKDKIFEMVGNRHEV